MQKESRFLFFIKRIFGNFRSRTLLAGTGSLILNISYAVLHGVVGIRTSSLWFFSLALYYFLLAIIGINAIWNELKFLESGKRKGEHALLQKEREIYRFCGNVICFMSAVILAVVFLMVFDRSTKEYGIKVCTAVAIYTVVKLTFSIRNFIKARKTSSPFVMALRDLGLTSSLVSLLSFQGAVLDIVLSENQALTSVLNAITGTIVLSVVFTTGLNIRQKTSHQN